MLQAMAITFKRSSTESLSLTQKDTKLAATDIIGKIIAPFGGISFYQVAKRRSNQ